MKRDSIFYKLFAQSPTLLFELIADSPENAASYRFDSIAIKEPRFEIDGVFLPPTDSAGTVYFCEVQFQKDEQLYERILSEVALYFYQNRSQFSDWQVVVIYPSRKTEQTDLHPHRSFLNGPQVHRVYLDELSNIRQLPLRVSLMALTTLKENQTIEEARYLSNRASQELPAEESRGISAIRWSLEL